MDGTFFVQMVKQIPPEFRIEAGTILHELRAALDHLACVLAIRNGKSAKDTYFPISRSLAVFEDDGIKRKLRNLSDADKKVIAALIGIDISFSEPEFIAGRPVSTVLRDFTRLVHSIVDLFDPIGSWNQKGALLTKRPSSISSPSI